MTNLASYKEIGYSGVTEIPTELGIVLGLMLLTLFIITTISEFKQKGS
jgi:hypothetical protein